MQIIFQALLCCCCQVTCFNHSRYSAYAYLEAVIVIFLLTISLKVVIMSIIKVYISWKEMSQGIQTSITDSYKTEECLRQMQNLILLYCLEEDTWNIVTQTYPLF